MSEGNLVIREALDSDLDSVMEVENAAFGNHIEIDTLVRDLLNDVSANPRLSLLAYRDATAVGHILFTRASLEPAAPLSISILAPLAIIPEAQKQGIGGRLIGHGLKMLRESGIDLVFVLGHIEYYPRHGFVPAFPLGFEAPYPIPEAVSDAWMVQELRLGVIGSFRGKVLCAKAMDKKEYWRE